MRQQVTLSSRLESLLGALVAPWEFASVDAWRDQIACSARDTVSAQHSQVSLDPRCGLAPVRSPDIDPALIDEYLRQWVHQDPFADMLSREGITPYVRSEAVQRVSGFAAQYDASPILNDFYRRAGLHDAAGIRRRHPHFAQLTVFSTTRTNPRFVRRASHVMPLAAPAFLAGALQIFSVATIRGQFVRNIDTIEAAIALYDTDGGRVHRNSALRTLLASYADASELVDLIDRAALTFASIGRAGSPGTQLAESTAGAMTWQWRNLTVSGSLARLGIEGSQPLVLLQIQPTRDSSTAPDAQRPTSVAPALTAREREVGVLLARGATNRAIAQCLDITEHTARRHTERVLRKLGVSSRAAVARALGLLRDSGSAE